MFFHLAKLFPAPINWSVHEVKLNLLSDESQLITKIFQCASLELFKWASLYHLITSHNFLSWLVKVSHQPLCAVLRAHLKKHAYYTKGSLKLFHQLKMELLIVSSEEIFSFINLPLTNPSEPNYWKKAAESY